jgi:adenylate kinase
MDARIAESRRQRDEERARSIEADERLRETVEVLRELTRTISEARLEVARLAGINPPHD